jgi:protein phosphatase
MKTVTTQLAEVLKERDGLAYISDVHGNPAIVDIIADLRARNRAIVFLGDIVDYGKESALAIRCVNDVVTSGYGVIAPGNHDWRFARWVAGKSTTQPETIESLDAAQDGEELKRVFTDIILSSHLWHRHGRYICAHGAVSNEMFERDPLVLRDFSNFKSVEREILALALYGQTDGTIDDLGRPRRIYDWIDRFYGVAHIGHDFVAKHVTTREGVWGGKVVFCDTGSSKSGTISVVEISQEELEHQEDIYDYA